MAVEVRRIDDPSARTLRLLGRGAIGQIAVNQLCDRKGGLGGLLIGAGVFSVPCLLERLRSSLPRLVGGPGRSVSPIV